MSIQSEITRISGNVSDAFTAITNKGVTVPVGSTSDDLADLISQISGGGSGLEYETGTYTPTSDIARPEISFAKTHNTRPFFVAICDMSGTYASGNSNLNWWIYSWYDLYGAGVYVNNTQVNYARGTGLYSTGSNFSSGNNNVSSLTDTGSTGINYYLTTSNFKPYTGSTSRYFRNGRSYKWIAVWTPTA